METKNYIIDILGDIISKIKVTKPLISPVEYFSINFQPGNSSQIINSLMQLDGTSLNGLKYPLIALKMPFSVSKNFNIQEVTFSKIIIANITKTGTNNENVLDKYSSDSVFKNIIHHIKDELIVQIAQSKYTAIGDPDMYDFTWKEFPFSGEIAEGVSDYVDFIEISNLKVQFYSSLKQCN